MEFKSKRYQDIYPESPLIESSKEVNARARGLLSLEYFEAEPGEMPTEVFAQHHILINLREDDTRVENWRDGEHRDFTFHKNEIVVTPAGVESGWKWHETSKVIVVTLEPSQLEKFAQLELGILLGESQLRDIPQFIDEDVTQAAVMLKEALHNQIGSDVMFESYARIFLIKLIQKYGVERDDGYAFDQSFTARHYQRVLEYVEGHYSSEVSIESLAVVAGLSTSHFSRLFKRTIGQSPHQFVMAYRVEKAKEKLAKPNELMIDIALACGFSDQAHFSRVFKSHTSVTPKQYRQSL